MLSHRYAQPSVGAPLLRKAGSSCACRVVFRQASNGDAARTDELPINDSTRPSHFEGVNNAVMEVDDAEASGMDEPWRGVADTPN